MTPLAPERGGQPPRTQCRLIICDLVESYSACVIAPRSSAVFKSINSCPFVGECSLPPTAIHPMIPNDPIINTVANNARRMTCSFLCKPTPIASKDR